MWVMADIKDSYNDDDDDDDVLISQLGKASQLIYLLVHLVACPCERF